MWKDIDNNFIASLDRWGLEDDFYTNLWKESVDLHTDNILPNNRTKTIQSGNTLPNNTKTSHCFISLAG